MRDIQYARSAFSSLSCGTACQTNHGQQPGSLAFLVRILTLTRPTLRVFRHPCHEMGLAKIYPGTKFEVSSFTRSKDMAQVPLLLNS